MAPDDSLASVYLSSNITLSTTPPGSPKPKPHPQPKRRLKRSTTPLEEPPHEPWSFRPTRAKRARIAPAPSSQTTTAQLDEGESQGGITMAMDRSTTPTVTPPPMRPLRKLTDIPPPLFPVQQMLPLPSRRSPVNKNHPKVPQTKEKERNLILPPPRQGSILPPPRKQAARPRSVAPQTPPLKKPRTTRSPSILSLLSSPVRNSLPTLSPCASKRATPLPPPPPRCPEISSPSSKKIDWSLCDPRARPSILFRLDYLQYGNPTYKQAQPQRSIPLRLPPPPPFLPSWVDTVDTRALGRRLDEEVFCGTCWVRDLISDVREEDRASAGPSGVQAPQGWQGMGKGEVGGISFYVLGKEFPCRNVTLLGYIVRCEVKPEKGIVEYSLDDSTGVIDLICSFGDGPSVKPFGRAVQDGMEIRGEVMAVGDLVRVTGKISEGRYQGADPCISVTSLQNLQDLNEEIDHHVNVRRLHQELYDLYPLDLRDLLDRTGEQQRKEQEEWLGSQASSSGGSEKKTKRPKLPAPATLGDRLTLETFTYYILYHLQSLPSALPRRRSDSPSPTISSTDTLLQGGDDDEETPPPVQFTIDQLQAARSLTGFAELLAQKNHLARTKKGRTTGGGKWERRSGREGMSKVIGGKGGSMRMLRPPGSPSKTPPSHSTTTTSNDQESNRTKLVGGLLQDAMTRLFVMAVREMRSSGIIIMSEAMLLSHSTSPQKLPNRGLEINFSRGEMLPDEPRRPGWFIDLGDEEVEKETVEVERQGVVRKGHGGFYTDFGTTEEDEDDWTPDFVTGKGVDVTPRPRSPFRSHHYISLSSPASTPRPGRQSIPDLAGAEAEEEEEEEEEDEEFKGFPTVEVTAYSVSMQEIDVEMYELVTPNSVAPQLLRIVRSYFTSLPVLHTKSNNSLTITINHAPPPKAQLKKVVRKGITEEEVRDLLGRDGKWEAVSKGVIVVEGLEWLVEKGELRRAGAGFILA